MKWDCKYKLFNKVLFSCEAIPSWKGSYGYLSNICNWINGYIDLQGSIHEHPKEKHNWIYSFLCEHSYTHCGKCWWFFSAPSMFLKCCTSLSIIYNQFDSIFFSVTVGLSDIGPGRDRTLHWHMCYCSCFWRCYGTSSGWSDWRSILHVSWVCSSTFVLRFFYASTTHLIPSFWIFLSLWIFLPSNLQSFIALRLMTKAVFGKSDDGERNGASM